MTSKRRQQLLMIFAAIAIVSLILTSISSLLTLVS